MKVAQVVLIVGVILVASSGAWQLPTEALQKWARITKWSPIVFKYS
jgi:hypothetical protein